MKIAAITKIKHGALFELLQKLGWSQVELARRCGYKGGGGDIGRIINLNARPSEHLLIRLAKAFAEAGEKIDVEELFPASYIGFKRSLSVIQVQDVEPEMIEKFVEHQRLMLTEAQPPVPGEAISSEEALEEFRSELDKREYELLRMIFVEQLSYAEAAKKLGISHQYIRNNLIPAALRKIRNVMDKEQKEPVPHVNLKRGKDGIFRPLKGDEEPLQAGCR